MLRKPHLLLDDILRAATEILGHCAGRSLGDYQADRPLHGMVERDFIIIGEAMAQLHRSHPQMAEAIAHWQQIVAFRNILVHAYAGISDQTVWDVVQTRLPALVSQVRGLLASSAQEGNT